MRMEAKTVLVVDDEVEIRQMIRDYLDAIGFRVLLAENGMQAIGALEKGSASEVPDILVMDVMMPSLDGFDAARRIRSFSNIPILLLTAKAGEADRVMGLDLGADDYLIKPFSMKELAARIRALLRRAGNTEKSRAEEEFHYGDLLISPKKMQIYRGEIPLPLTPAQFRIALTLFSQPGRVFTRMQLLESFQQEAFEGYERTIDVHIKNIRKVIEEDPARPKLILTVWGTGYRAAE